jgi:hypothetical protein
MLIVNDKINFGPNQAFQRRKEIGQKPNRSRLNVNFVTFD